MAFFLAIMTFLTFIQVVLRYVFNSGWVWSLEATTYTFAWLVLLGMAYGVRTKTHIAVDLVVGRLSGLSQKISSYLCLSICLAYSVLMAYGGTIFVTRLFQLGNDARDLPVARWILTVMLPLGFALLALRFAQLGWQFVRGNIDRLGFGEHEAPELLDEISSSGGELDK